jgi:lysozyme family protein
MGKNIETLLDELIEREGGYVDHPADRGGPTNFGITEQTARAYGYRGAMKQLPRSTAKQIYRQLYWTRPGFDDVAARLPDLGTELFDTGVNMGPKVAAKFLQRALNVLNQQERDFRDIDVDGDIGPGTIYALSRLIAKRGEKPAGTALFRIVDSLQGARYLDLAERTPSQEAFMYGWITNRVGPA